MAYYNTNREGGNTLRLSWGKADKQENMIMEIFQERARQTLAGLAPHQVRDKIAQDYGKQYPLTSIRRAISNLTDNGELVKLDRMVPGNYGKNVHTWRLRGI
jgi:hypothetical protein|tara:strand:+ start:687 stop:992 length:306 start_codon:yes stop_codon:yes gene_type:complete